MKKYINKLCIINNENPTPSKEQDVAINITATDRTYNFVLAISNIHQCCEYWEAKLDVPEYVKPSEGTGDYIAFVNSIEVIEQEIEDYEGGKIIARVETNKGIFEGYVLCEHNGYYSHEVEILEDNELIYSELL